MSFWIRAFLALVWFLGACLLAVPLCVLRWGDLRNVHDIGRMMAFGILPLARVRVEVEGGQWLGPEHQPCVYVGNHQSGFDVPLFGRFCPNRIIAVGKKELKWVPFFNLAWMGSGNVSIDRGNRIKAVAGLEDVVRAIRGKGASVVIFPEGTRNRQGGDLLPFKKGAFHMAIAAQVPVVPIVLSPVTRVLDFKARRLGGTMRVKVLPPVSTQGLTRDDVDALTQKVRGQMVEAFRSLA